VQLFSLDSEVRFRCWNFNTAGQSRRRILCFPELTIHTGSVPDCPFFDTKQAKIPASLLPRNEGYDPTEHSA